MLLVQNYLRNNKSLTDLKVEHGVKSFVENKKISLTYDQIEAKDSDPLAQQCRGLILREQTYDIVACPMFRFFNYEQTSLLPDIDWSTAVFEDKLDGTLIITYFDELQNKWCVATRSRPEANVKIEGGTLTFSDLVDVAAKEVTKKESANTQWLMRNADPTHTYCFELTSPTNRIVCKYDDISVTLLAVRCNKTLEEKCPREWAEKLEVPPVKCYDFDNIDHMIQVVRDWNPEEKEGVVIKDSNFRRIKVKNPAYVAFNHMRDSLSTSFKGCIEVILLGKDDDVIGMMPDYIANRIKRIKANMQEIFRITQEDYEEIKHIESMKEFAAEAELKLWPSALYALKRNKSPDLKTFAMGNKKDLKIPSTSIKAILSLCEKIDPSLRGEVENIASED